MANATYENIDHKTNNINGGEIDWEHDDLPEPPKHEFGALPEGWEEFNVDGRSVFINHNSGETSWIDPRTKDMVRTRADLPFGWEKTMDPIVGVYFMNHVERKNVLEDPRRSKEYGDQFKKFDLITTLARTDVEKKKKTLTMRRQQLDEDEELLVEHRRLKEEMLAAQREQELNENTKARMVELDAQIALEQEALQKGEDEQAELEAGVEEAHELVYALEVLGGASKNKLDESNMDEAREATEQIKEFRKTLHKQFHEKSSLEKEVRELTTEVFGADEFGLTSSAETGSAPVAPEPDDLGLKEDDARTMLDLRLELLTMQKMVEEQKKEIDALVVLKVDITSVKAEIIAAEEAAFEAAMAKAEAKADAELARAGAADAAARVGQKRGSHVINRNAPRTIPIDDKDQDVSRTEWLDRIRKDKGRYKTLRRALVGNTDANRKNPELLGFSEKLNYFTSRINEVSGDVTVAPKAKKFDDSSWMNKAN